MALARNLPWGSLRFEVGDVNLRMVSKQTRWSHSDDHHNRDNYVATSRRPHRDGPTCTTTLRATDDRFITAPRCAVLDNRNSKPSRCKLQGWFNGASCCADLIVVSRSTASLHRSCKKPLYRSTVCPSEAAAAQKVTVAVARCRLAGMWRLPFN